MLHKNSFRRIVARRKTTAANSTKTIALRPSAVSIIIAFSGSIRSGEIIKKALWAFTPSDRMAPLTVTTEQPLKEYMLSELVTIKGKTSDATGSIGLQVVKVSADGSANVATSTSKEEYSSWPAIFSITAAKSFFTSLYQSCVHPLRTEFSSRGSIYVGGVTR